MNFPFRVSRCQAGASFFLALLVVTASVSPITAATCVTPPAGLVGLWRGQSNTLDSWAGHDALAEGSLAYDVAEVGSGFFFTGKPAAVHVPGDAATDVGTGDGFTLEAWIRPASLSGVQSLFGWYNDSYWASHIFLIGNQLYANLPDRNGNWRPVTSSGAGLAPNVWQHVAITYRKPAGVVELWLNGNAVAEKIIGADSPDTRNDLYFGSRPNCGKTNSFSGGIDEISLYRRALTADEINSIYQAGTEGKCGTTAEPRIVKNPSLTAVQPGKAATLTVRADGANPMRYQWICNGTNVPDSSSATLKITRARPQHAGNYCVVVTNPFGGVTSEHVRLVILPKFPSIDQLILQVAKLHLDRTTMRSTLTQLRLAKASADAGKLTAAVQILDTFRANLPMLLPTQDSDRLASLTAATDAALTAVRSLLQ